MTLNRAHTSVKAADVTKIVTVKQNLGDATSREEYGDGPLNPNGT